MSDLDKSDGMGKSGGDAVSRAYRDARDRDGMLPPPAMDDAIRAAARRAVKSGPQPAGKNWIRQWTPQLAVAAVVVLSVSVLFVSVEERPDLAPAPLQELAMKRQTDVAAPLETKIIEAVPEPKIASAIVKKKASAEADSAVAPSVEPQAARMHDSARAMQERSAPALPSPPAPSQLAAAGNVPAAPAFAPPAPVAPAPFPAAVADAAAPARKESLAEARPAAPREAAASEAKAAVSGLLRSRENAEIAARAASNAAPAPATTVAPAAPVAMAKQAAPVPAPAVPVSPSVTFSGKKDKQESASAGIRGFAREDAPASTKPADDERAGPWLKRLQELREQGKLKELRDELVRFRKAHPEVVLPKELAAIALEKP